MEVLTIGSLVLAVLAGLAWRAWNARNDPGPEPSSGLPLYATAAAACGLTDVETGGRPRRRTLDGVRGPLRVRVEQKALDKGEEGEPRRYETRIVVERREGVVPITLRRERRGFLQRDLSAREIEIGDKAFDDDFHVTGPHVFVRALLDAETRRLLRALLVKIDLQVDRGSLSGTLPVTMPWPLHEWALARILGALLEAAGRLERPVDVARRLAENARRDPLPEVRLQNLLMLVREYPERPATDEALLTACADTSDWIRVRAATALGERGRTTLLEVALRDPPDDAATAQAISVLGDRLTRERVSGILGRALRARQPGTVRACLEALASRGGGEGVEEIARVMSVEKGELAVAAADALGATGSALAEPPLVGALARDVAGLPRAAARALGRVGTAAAVAPLKEAEGRARDADFGRAARQAVAEIQARLPGASPGQLSIAAGEIGTLSLVEDERGRLSLPRPDER
jgi:HEAT repeat protein